MNYLPKNVSNSLVLNADDVTAVLKAYTDTELKVKVSETLFKLGNRITVNGLKLNKDKI